MRIHHLTTDQFKNQKKAFQGSVVFVLSLEAWKKAKWLGELPAAYRKRIEKASARLKEPLEEGSQLCVQGFERDDEDLLIALLPEEKESFYLLEFGREVFKAAVKQGTKRLAVWVHEEEHSRKVSDALGSALSARVFLMPVFGKRKEKQKPFQLAETSFVSPSKQDFAEFERGYALGEGTNLARFLATLPPNILNPATYGDRIRKLGREFGFKVKFHSNKDLKRMGAGAFTAVDQANPESKGGIYELSYEPKGRSANSAKPVALVGKGMCFDTGGYDVKIQGSMLTMKGDMQGSAVALAGIVTAARLKWPRPMKAWLAVTENHISPRGYKADEVITALNGLSIEVVNTDAEGRMVLADTLTLASRENPECVIDFATLTGSAVRSLGTRFSAGFTNRRNWHSKIVDAGEDSGERVWTFPTDKTYFRPLKSKVADTVQCLKAGGADHIYAACFLSKFVKENVPWVHIDLSASENDDGLAHVDSMFTGFGVRWLYRFLDTLD